MPSLFIVPTPIGNLQDVTLRALDVFKTCKYFLSEDTRVTRKLFGLLEIDYKDKSFLTYNDTNEKKVIPHVLRLFGEGKDIALVSDAGMPLISDPGYKLISYIKTHPELCDAIKIEVLPGASAVTTALVASGFPPDRFTYLGYLPRKPSDTKKLFLSIKRRNREFKCSYVCFESPYRIEHALRSMDQYLGPNIKVALCNELTKMHQKILIDSAQGLLAKINKDKLNIKGEITLVFNLFE